MTLYCMELATEPRNAHIHKVSCGSFDLGTLLGSGKIASLGDFDSSEMALDEARKHHPGAVCCRDCCINDLKLSPDPKAEASSPQKYAVEKEPSREVENADASILNLQPQRFLACPAEKVALAAAIPGYRGQFPVVMPA